MWFPLVGRCLPVGLLEPVRLGHVRRHGGFTTPLALANEKGRRLPLCAGIRASRLDQPSCFALSLNSCESALREKADRSTSPAIIDSYLIDT